MLKVRTTCRWSTQYWLHDGGSRLQDWPEHFPESCPPSDAEPPQGSYYRIVDSDPPTSDDFVSNLRLKQLGLRFKGGKRRWSDDCQAAGLSILEDLTEVKNLRDSCGPMRSKAIAYGDISDDGLIKHTPGKSGASHHTWWLPVESQPALYFRVVA